MHLRHPSPPTALTVVALVLAFVGVYGAFQLPVPHGFWPERTAPADRASGKKPAKVTPASGAAVNDLPPFRGA